MKRILFVFTMLLTSVLGAMAYEQGEYYKYDPALYNQETVVYVTLVKADGSQYDANDGQFYIGAFIGDSCRAEATNPERVLDSNTGEILGIAYVLRVGGNDEDAGKDITFRVLKVDNSLPTIGGDEFTIPSTITVPYGAETTVGTPSDPFKITFVPATFIDMVNPLKMHRGEKRDMLEVLDITPEGALLPELIWDYANSASYITMDGNVLEALNITEDGLAYLGVQSPSGSLSAYTEIEIDAPADSANWIEPYGEGITASVTVNINDSEALMPFLTKDQGYSLTPRDATTQLVWTSSDETILAPADAFYGFIPVKAGNATLTGTSANDDSPIQLILNVTVLQPVQEIWLGETPNDNPVVMVQVGDDVSARLASIINMQPADATNKEYDLIISEDNHTLAIDSGKVKAVEAWNWFSPTLAGVNTLTIRAMDGSNVERTLTIYVVPKQPTSIDYVKETIYLTKSAEEEWTDCTDAILNNLTLKPEDVKLTDCENFYISFENANGSGSNVVSQDGESVESFQYRINESGECYANVSVDHLDYMNAYVYMGDSYPTVPRTPLTTKFKIVVREGLTSFVIPDMLVMNRDEECPLTLTPQPEDAEFDPALLSISVVPNLQKPMPNGWKYVEATATDNTGLNYTLQPYSVGNGTIYIYYGGTPMGQGSITVDQQLKLNNGWQWVAICQGAIDDFSSFFGDNLDEARSQDQLVFNDKKAGLFGDLKAFVPMQGYKLKMKDLDANDMGYIVAITPDDNSYFDNSIGTDISTRAGWNWIGTPYQYYQNLNIAFEDTTLLSIGDIIKGKNAHAEYTANGWVGSLQYFTPGEGYMMKTTSAKHLRFSGEFYLNQNMVAPTGARSMNSSAPLFDIDSKRFADNMAMVASVNAVSNPNYCTVYAFVGDECRGRGVNVDNRQFITIHGTPGETVTFRIYDEQTGELYDCNETCTLQMANGSYAAPVALNAGKPTAISSQSIGNRTISFDGYQISFNGKDIKRMRVVNAGGAEMMSGNEAVVDMSQLPSGIYMVIVEMTNGQRISKKIVK